MALTPFHLCSVLLSCAVNHAELQAGGAEPSLPAAQSWLVANGTSHPQPVTPAPMSNTYAPQPGDARLQRGDVSIEQVEIADMSGGAVQLLTISGSLPTPCHSLRLQIPPAASADGVLRIRAWSISDPAVMCAQMLQPFTVQLPISARAALAISVDDVMP